MKNNFSENIDAEKMSDPSLWRYPDILPNKGFAFQQILWIATPTILLSQFL